jgi:hypothetical protein
MKYFTKQVVRECGIGTITHKVASSSNKGSSPPGRFSPRWMVAFEEGSQEEISEKGLRRTIGGIESDDNGNGFSHTVSKAPW